MVAVTDSSAESRAAAPSLTRTAVAVAARETLGQTLRPIVPKADASNGIIPRGGQFVSVPVDPAIRPYLDLYPLPNGRDPGSRNQWLTAEHNYILSPGLEDIGDSRNPRIWVFTSIRSGTAIGSRSPDQANGAVPVPTAPSSSPVTLCPPCGSRCRRDDLMKRS